MSTPPPREIGTLIVVVLKANHLPNKRHIGKQDPYCLAIVNGEKKRTKAIKRGGQHPEWDEELRFTLFEDDDDLSVKSASGTPPPLPPKDARSPKKIQGGNAMKIACYADDPREPDLIGETEVDLTEVLTKGETDEWFTLSNKDKFAGKVYLELTFWSNAPPPEKKVTPRPPKSNKQYAGPGSFVPSNESPSRIGPSSVYANPRPSDTNSVAVPSSLRSSNSLAKLDLYVPPYEKPVTTVSDSIASEFNDMGISQHRESLSSAQYEYAPVVASNLYLGDMHSHNRPSNPHSTLMPYHYDPSHPPAPVRSSRLPNIPVSSSGFMPINSASAFSASAHISDTFPYPLPLSHTPAPSNPVMYHPTNNYLPVQVPLPPSYIPSTTAAPYTPQVFQPQLQHYPSYPSTQTPAPPQQYGLPVIPPRGHSPAPYPAYQSVTPSHEPIPTGNSTSSVNGTSRPLPPEPHVIYTPPLSGVVQEGIPPPPPPLPLPPPPPPPPPPVQYPPVPPSQIPVVPIYPVDRGSPAPPPPLPPAVTSAQNPPFRRASLPVPPRPFPHQQLPYQPPPPPPPPPLPVHATEEYSFASVPPPPLMQ